MARTLRTLLSIVVTLWYPLSTAMSSPSNPAIVPYYSIRSQGLDTPRQLCGLVQQEYTVVCPSYHGALAATLAYDRSFSPDHVVRALFGTTDCQSPAITISGSQVPNRSATDWLADYFYLPNNFKSTLTFKPVVSNLTLDLLFFMGLDEWVKGLYIGIYAPLVHTRWNLGMCETIDMVGTNSMIPGYFSPDTLPRNELLSSFSEYANGVIIGPIVQKVGGTNYTITFDRLQNARMSSCSLARTGFADVRMEVGYEFLRHTCYGVGFAGELVVPAGNKPKGQYLFEPVIGNGNSWELGFNLNGYLKPWYSSDGEKQIIFYATAMATHLFGARQQRTFDFKEKPFSRYILMERLNSTIVDNLEGNGTAPTAQFFNEFAPAANITRLTIATSSGVQAEITAMATFVCHGWSWDVGYNFWYRSTEHIKLRGINPGINNTSWAIKGDAMMFGFDSGVGAVPLSATESEATIYSGTNFVPTRTFAQGMLNPGIDNPENATGDATNGTASNPLSASPSTVTTPIQTSIQPVFPDGSSINLCEGSTRGLSNKVFTHVSYRWPRPRKWNPFVGIGGEVEWAKAPASCSECTSGVLCGLSQWGVWIKAGLSY